MLVPDTGALLAYDRGDRTVQAFLERASRNRTDVVTTTGAVAQVWRNGNRNARLALLLRAVLEVELGSEHARRIGALLGTAKLAEVVHALSALGTAYLTSRVQFVGTGCPDRRRPAGRCRPATPPRRARRRRCGPRPATAGSCAGRRRASSRMAPTDSGAASGLLQTMQQTGAILGRSVLVTNHRQAQQRRQNRYPPRS